MSTQPAETNAVSLPPSIARRVARVAQGLASMTEHSGAAEGWRPVVIVAREGRRPDVFTQYSRLPIGTVLGTGPRDMLRDFDYAQIVAE